VPPPLDIIGLVAKAYVIRVMYWTEAANFLYSIGKLAPCAPGLHNALQYVAVHFCWLMTNDQLMMKAFIFTCNFSPGVP
jgi:hypothetical protein